MENKKTNIKNISASHANTTRFLYIRRFVLGFLVIAFSSAHLYSQNILEDTLGMADANLLFKQQALGGITAHTEGWGFFFRRAKILNIYRKIFWEAEAVTMHDEHEYKMSDANDPDASPYYFGKLNGMETIRLGVGASQMLWRKSDLSCTQIDVVYAVGASIAILKPVYLDIIPSNGDDLPIAEQYDPNTDTPTNIYGRASVFDGLGQLSFYPGGYGRVALNFDFSNRHQLVKALEVGVVVDAYDKVIPIMAFAKNNQAFVNLYVSFSLGKRWAE